MRESARTIALPLPFVQGTVLLIARTLRVQRAEAQTIVDRLFSHRTPTFGELWETTEGDVQRVTADAAIAISPLDARQLREVLRKVDPWTPVCGMCGELTLSAVAGTVYEMPAPGTVCPLCSAGKIALTAVTLRRVNWATGMLVEPGLAEDVRSVRGRVIPLSDAKIRAWAGTVDARLDRALHEAGLPLYGLLAYFNLRLNQPATFGPREAERLLARPSEFGLDDPQELARAIVGALRFLDEREVTNLPSAYLTDGKRRDEFLSVTVNGRRYLLEGLVGQGDACDVYRGRSDATPTTFVIVKVLTSDNAEDARRLRDETAMIRRLGELTDVESEFYLRFVPRLVDNGSIVFPSGARMDCTVFRAEHQFDWSLDDVIRAYPDGIHPKDLVWMMNRTCELLTWLHARRLVHRAVIPAHLLVKTSTHRFRLVDWSDASSFDRPINAYSASNRGYYPDAILSGAAFGPAHDLAMACRVGIALLGGEPANGWAPARIRTDDDGVIGVPEPLVAMLRDHAMYPDSRPTARDARAFKERFGATAQAAYGPPRYHLFTMPRR